MNLSFFSFYLKMIMSQGKATSNVKTAKAGPLKVQATCDIDKAKTRFSNVLATCNLEVAGKEFCKEQGVNHLQCKNSIARLA